MSGSRALTRSRTRQRGVAAVEFGLLLTPLVLMLVGTTELGRAIYSYNTLDKTVRDAARHLSQHGPGNTTIADEARCLAVYGNTDVVAGGGACTSTVPVAPGLTIGMVQLCDASVCAGTHANVSTGLGSINLVTVSIQGYPYSSIVPALIPSMNFNNIAVTMRAQL